MSAKEIEATVRLDMEARRRRHVLYQLSKGDYADSELMNSIAGQKRRHWKRFHQAFTGLSRQELTEVGA